MNKKLNTNFSMKKLLLTALVTGPLATLPAPLWALPDISSANLTTSAGVTVQSVGGNTLNISAPDKSILYWTAFGSGTSTILPGDILNYSLPTASSSVLNNVSNPSGTVASVINGQIQSNGNVYILNTAGIVIGATAQISVGGFYASTVPEAPGFFSSTGALTFNGTGTTANIVVQGTGTTTGTDAASIQATGPGNNIYLAANAVNVQGGKFFGNLFTRASSTSANPLTGGVVADGAAAGVNTSFASTGPVSINTVGVVATGGGLNVATNGGNVSLTTGASAVTISPGVTASPAAQVSVNTTSSSLNGSISQIGAGSFTASTTGTAVTLNAGTGTSAGNITLTNVDFLTVGMSGNNIAITDKTGDLAIAATNAAGTLAITTQGPVVNGTTFGNITSPGAITAGGLITISTPVNTAVTLTGAGNISFGTISTSSSLNITSSGDVTFTAPTVTTNRNMTIVSTGGQITTNAIVAGSTVTLTANSSAGKITATSISSRTGTFSATGDITISSSLVQGGNAGLTITSSAGNITTGTITAATNLTLTATAGSITTGNITSTTLTMNAANGSITTGALTATNTVTYSAGSITTGTISSTSAFTATASSGSISVGALSTTSNFTLTATNGSITTSTITSTSAVTLSAPSLAGSILTGAINSTVPAAGPQLVSLTSGGSITLSGGTIPYLSVTSTAGSITQGAAITSTSKATFNAGGDITLPLTNDFNNVVLIGGAQATSGINVADVNSIIIGGGTATKAPTIITAGAAAATANITLGALATDALSFGSTLTLQQATGTTGGSISTIANTVNVFGNVSVTTQNNNSATLGSNLFGAAANYGFGQVTASVGTGTFSVYENTTLNLGNITAANLDARSFNGDIVNTGKLTTTAGSLFAAGSFLTQGNITLNNFSNSLAGTIVIGNAKDFTLTNTISTAIQAGTALVNGKAATGAVAVTVTGANTNTLTMTAVNNGDYNIVGFNAPGAVTIVDPNGLTLQNATNTISNGAALIDISAAGPIVLGSGINLGGNGITKFTSTYTAGNATPGITDSAAGIRIFGEAQFVSAGNIAITNLGHSFGAVSLTTTAAATAATVPTPATGTLGLQNVTFTEGGSLVLKNVSVGTSTFPGTLTLTSTGGSITQAAGGTIVVPTVTAANTVNISAPTGSVTLNNAGNKIETVLNLSALGNSSLTQTLATPTNVVYLGNVAVTNGTFNLDVSATAGQKVVQAATTAMKIYGNTTVNTQAGTVTLTNTGNNFGGVTITTNTSAAAGADIAITESGVLNFLTVNSGTTGKLTAVSENASIIQSGTTGLTVGGTTSLTAATGITLNTPTTTNVFGGANGIMISTPGNVSIQDAAAVTALAGGTTIGGAATIKNTFATGGEIRDLTGVITIGGNVFLDTGTVYNAVTDVGARINLGNSTLSLGAIRFNSGKVSIFESTTLNLAAGSFALGSVTLSTNGNIVTSGAGGATFQNTLQLSANGSITISNPFTVLGSNGVGLTFRSLGAVDLSTLSLAGNLNNIAPTNLGAPGGYKPPSP